MDFIKKNIILNYIIPSIIALGVAVPLFAEAAELSTVDEDIKTVFHSLSGGLQGYQNLKIAWQPRFFSNELAALMGRLCDWILLKTSVPFVENPLELTVALWTASWFLLICLFLILATKRRSVFHIFGIFTALAFGYMPRLSIRIYTWDMPALFIFTAFVILFIHNKKWWLFALLPIGMGFKETTLILCAAFLFMDLPWKERWMMAIGAAVLCVAIKFMLGVYVGLPVSFFTMENGFESSRIRNYYIIRNLIGLKQIIPLIINSGTLLAFFLLPIHDRRMLALKLIAVFFIAGNMFFGNIFEYRIWFEMIPFALYGLEIASYGTSSLASSETDQA